MYQKVRKHCFAATLPLLLTLSLCACTQEQAENPVEEAKDSAIELPVATEELADRENMKSPDSPESTESAESTAWTQDAEASLTLLREKISGDPVMFGAAYLGYVGGLFDEGFEQGFPIWLRENNPAMLDEYPFIEEIDAEHIIGGAGHLYCIVPVDENATVAVNRIKWDDRTQTYENIDVLYRSEVGHPILVFANLDGIASNVDTQIHITDNNGRSCAWYPSLDEELSDCLVPCIINGECLSRDFTESQSGSAEALGDWLAAGWLGPTALGLAGSDAWGMTWCTSGTAWDTDRQAWFMLTFYPGDDTGGAVDLDWQYDGEEEFEEQWSGFWTIETELDMPSRVTIRLSRVGGKSYDTADGPMYLSETYPIMIAPSGENLLISKGENGVCLPFTGSSPAAVLTLAMG